MTQALQQLKDIHSQSYSTIPFEEFKEKYRKKFYADISSEDFERKINPPIEETQRTEEQIEQDGQQKEGMFSYVLDQAQLGVSDLLRGLDPRQRFADFENAAESIKKFGVAPSVEEQEAYESEITARREEYGKTFGYEGLQPRTEAEQLLGLAAYETAREGPLAIAGARGPLSASLELGASYLSSLAGGAGANIAKDLGGEQLSQQIAGTVLGSGTSLTGAGVRGTLSTIQQTRAAMKTPEKAGKLKDSVDKLTDFVSTNEVGVALDKALTVQADLPEVIAATQKLSEVIPQLKDNPIPAFSILADNKVLEKNLDRLLVTRPEFVAQAKADLSNARNAVQQYQESKFGKSGPDVDEAIRQTVGADYAKKLSQTTKNIRTLDDQLDNLALNFQTDVDLVNVGQRASNIVKAKEQQVRDKLSPQYERAIIQANKDGIRLPATSVKSIHDYVRLTKRRDTFTTFPKLYDMINNNFSPNTKGQFKQQDVRTLDSLKRRINKDMRKATDAADARVLQGLKDLVDTQIQKLPESFSKPYRDLDRTYYNELGVPFSAEGIRQFNSSRFNLTAGNVLTKPEQAMDFLRVAGDEGIPVVRDAILNKMGPTVVKDGVVDLRAYRRFVTQNKRLIDSVPGMRQQLADFAGTIRGIDETRAKLDSDFIKYSAEKTHEFYKVTNEKGLVGVVDDMIRNNVRADSYLRDIEDFTPDTKDMVINGLRSQFLDRAAKQPNKTMVQFLEDNKNVVNKLFGADYITNVKAISEATDILNKVDIDTRRFAIDYSRSDDLEQAVGISFPQLQSILRDRITNPGTKLAIIASKITSNSTATKRDDAMMQLMLKPEALAELQAKAKAIREKKFTMETPKEIEGMMNVVNRSIAKSAIFYTETAEAVAQDEAPEINYDY